MAKAPKGAKRELIDVDVKTISLVRKPANRKPFAFFKSEDGGPPDDDLMLYKAGDWDNDDPETGEETKSWRDAPLIRSILGILKGIGGNRNPETKTDTGEGLDKALAGIDGLGEFLGQASKEGKMAGLTKEQVTALVEAEVEKRLATAEDGETMDAAEGLTETSKASEVISRLHDVLAGQEADIEKAEGEGEDRSEARKGLTTVATKMLALLKSIPEDARQIAKGKKGKGGKGETEEEDAKTRDQKKADAAVKAAEAALAKAKIAAVKGSAGPGEAMDATATGNFDDAMNPATEALIEARFADLIKDVEAKHAKATKNLLKQIADLKKRAGVSALGDPEDAGAGDTDTADDEGLLKQSPWSEDEAAGLDPTDTDESLALAKSVREEEDFGADPGFQNRK